MVSAALRDAARRVCRHAFMDEISAGLGRLGCSRCIVIGNRLECCDGPVGNHPGSVGEVLGRETNIPAPWNPSVRFCRGIGSCLPIVSMRVSFLATPNAGSVMQCSSSSEVNHAYDFEKTYFSDDQFLLSPSGNRRKGVSSSLAWLTES